MARRRIGHSARRQGSSADDPKLRLASRYMAGGKRDLLVIRYPVDEIHTKSGMSKKIIFIQWSLSEL